MLHSFIHSCIEQILLYCPLHVSVVVHMVKKISTNCLLTKLSLEGTRASNQADTILCYLVTYIGEVQDVMGLPKWLSGKEPACCDRRHGSIPGSGRSPGGGNGNPLQYSHLENSVDRGTCRVVAYWLQRVRHDWARTRACFSLELLIHLWISHRDLCLDLLICEVTAFIFTTRDIENLN